MIINMLAVCQLVKNVIKDSPSRSRFARYRDETPGQEGSCEVSSLKKFTSEIINIYHKKTPLLDRRGGANEAAPKEQTNECRGGGIKIRFMIF